MLKRSKILLIVLLFALIAVGVFVYIKYKKNGANEEPVVQKTDWPNIDYSRVSFFNASKDRASMNLPEMWEGKYRIKEEGDVVDFLFLKKDGTTEKMFGVAKKKPAAESDRVLCKKGGLDFVLVDYGFTDKEDMTEFKDGLEFFIKSLKCG